MLPGASTTNFPYLVRGSGPEVYIIDAPPPLGAELVGLEVPARVAPGELATITLRARNTGSMTWERDVVGVAPVEPRDHDSVLCNASSWTSCRRAASIAGTTKPGDVGIFTFAIRAPTEVGVVRECWNLHARAGDKDHWFSDPGQFGPKDDAICREIVIGADPPGDAGADALAMDGSDLTGGCGCRTQRARGDVTFFVLGAVAIAVGRARSRRRK
jgi:hypothetical protein